MRILVTAANLIPPRGGGERSLFAFLNRLSKYHNVEVITPNDKDSIKEENGYKITAVKRPAYFKILKSYVKINIQNSWWEKILKDKIEKEKHDLLISQGIVIPTTTNLKIKKMIFVRGVGFFAPNVDSVDPYKCKKGFFWYLPWIFKLQYPLLVNYRKKCIRALQKANMIVCNVNFLVEITKKYTGKNSEILNSEIVAEKYKIKRNKDSEEILFINPTLPKGVDLMWRIASRLPDKKFVIAGKTDLLGRRYYKKLEKMKNVRCLGQMNDMRQAYVNSYLLVNTSKCYEGFGRTPAEAMVNGIPSVSTGIGGLREVIGKTGDIVENMFNIDEWVVKIRKYDNKNYLAEKSTKCINRVSSFKLKNEAQFKKINKLLEKMSTKC